MQIDFQKFLGKCVFIYTHTFVDRFSAPGLTYLQSEPFCPLISIQRMAYLLQTVLLIFPTTLSSGFHGSLTTVGPWGRLGGRRKEGARVFPCPSVCYKPKKNIGCFSKSLDFIYKMRVSLSLLLCNTLSLAVFSQCRLKYEGNKSNNCAFNCNGPPLRMERHGGGPQEMASIRATATSFGAKMRGGKAPGQHSHQKPPWGQRAPHLRYHARWV